MKLIDTRKKLNNVLTDKSKRYVRSMLKVTLVTLHQNIGRAIRNEFNLWNSFDKELMEDILAEYPQILKEHLWNGIQNPAHPHFADSICHPDQFSLAILEDYWEYLQNKEKTGTKKEQHWLRGMIS